jgi:hypothetical protein
MLQALGKLFTFKNRRVTPDAAVMRGAPPPSIAVFNAHFKTHGLADLLNHYSFDPETQLYHSAFNAAFIDAKAVPKSYGFILEIPPSPGGSEEMARVMLGLFNQQYVTGTALQVCLYASPEITPALQYWMNARKPGSIYARMAQRRADYCCKVCGSRCSVTPPTCYGIFVAHFRCSCRVSLTHMTSPMRCPYGMA